LKGEAKFEKKRSPLKRSVMRCSVFLNNMKWITSLLILVLVTSAIVRAQSLSNEAHKLEVIPNTHADNEQAYLDLLAKALGDDLASRGFLVAYRKSDLPPGTFLRRVYGYRDYYLVNMRGIERNRVEVIEGGVKGDTFTEIWLVPASAKPPAADSQLNLVPQLPLKFDVAYPDCPSEMSVYLEDLTDSLRFYARALLANPNVSAKIIAYPGHRSTVRKVARIGTHARAHLIANYHIDGKRIATIANNRRRNCSQLELWLTRQR
jgi:hypothetical protein